jgi:membrane protease subunit HflC
MEYKKLLKYKFIIIAAIVLVFISSFFFSVFETQSVLITRFGKISKIIKTPGLHYKIPLLDQAIFFDNRILNINLPAKEIISQDQKRFIIDAYLLYKIKDEKAFYEAFYNQENGNIKISSIFDSDVRQIIAQNKLTNLFIQERKKEILSNISSLLKNGIEKFGIELFDIKIVRIDLPNENIDSIFQRMKSDREKEAKLLRAEGDGTYTATLAEVDKESNIIRSKASLIASKIKNSADAESIKIISNVANKDPEFYDFYKSMISYKSLSENNKEMELTISPKTFKFFKHLID